MKEGDWYMFVDSGGVFSLIRVDGFGVGLTGTDGEAVHYTKFARINDFAQEKHHAHITHFMKHLPHATQLDPQVAEDLLTTFTKENLM